VRRYESARHRGFLIQQVGAVGDVPVEAGYFPQQRERKREKKSVR